MPNDLWRWLRTPEGRREVEAFRAECEEFEWRELRDRVHSVVSRFSHFVGGLRACSLDDTAIAERALRWCRHEAQLAVLTLQHLPTVADGQGGVFDDLGAAFDDSSDDLFRQFVNVVMDRIDSVSPPTPSFSDDELDALTRLLSHHLTLAGRARECLIVVVPEQPPLAHPPIDAGVRLAARHGSSDIQYVFGPLVELTLRARVGGRAARRPDDSSDVADLWARKRWPVGLVVKEARGVLSTDALEGASGWSWFADVSERTVKTHAIRVLEQLAGLVALSHSVRPPRSVVRLLAVETETAMGEASTHAIPLVVGTHRVECSVPGDLSELSFDPWWEKFGWRFMSDLHGYAANATQVAGRFRRALHFWSRAEAAFGTSAYDVADRFLQYMSAIEVAISSRSRVTQSVCQRVANICRSADVKREMKDLYDARSRYVHDGLPHVRWLSLLRLRELARLVLRDLAQWSVEHGLDTDHARYVAHCDLRAVGG